MNTATDPTTAEVDISPEAVERVAAVCDFCSEEGDGARDAAELLRALRSALTAEAKQLEKAEDALREIASWVSHPTGDIANRTLYRIQRMKEGRDE